MDFYPVISTVNGAYLAGTSVAGNAETLAKSINGHAGAKVATVGDPVPMNPAYSKARDPERTMLTALATAARKVTGDALATVEAAANGQDPAPKSADKAPAKAPATRRTRAARK